VARIVVSDGGHFVHALDRSGRILYHFPSTLGSKYAPSPSGSYSVRGVAWNPTWHYQPDLLTGVPDHQDDAVLPKGPNNAVGVVWMDLSVEHYGIHGTSAPETIGYATSHGCVRLTNWDAAFLAARVSGGTPVEFRDPDQAQRPSPVGGS
jgi:lipoprotein-anchoring transpeptidase ErfK/SrfK